MSHISGRVGRHAGAAGGASALTLTTTFPPLHLLLHSITLPAISGFSGI